MCLNVSLATTKEFLKEHGGQKTIKVYKVLYLNRDSTNINNGELYLGSPFMTYIWKAGLNKSDCGFIRKWWYKFRLLESKLLCGEETFLYRSAFDINKSFHVFLNKPDLLQRGHFNFSNKYAIVVEFEAKLRDFIAAQSFYNGECGIELAFTRLTLPQSEYDRAFNEGIPL